MSTEITAAISERRIVAIAKEIALDLHEVSAILARHGVSGREWAVLAENAIFKLALQDFKTAYATAEGQAERIAMKARMAAEESIEDMYRLVTVGDADAGTSRVNAWKALCEVGGLVKKAGDGGGGTKVAINIDFGGGLGVRAAPVTIDAE